jgi:hypothetical protein
MKMKHLSYGHDFSEFGRVKLLKKFFQNTWREATILIRLHGVVP